MLAFIGRIHNLKDLKVLPGSVELACRSRSVLRRRFTFTVRFRAKREQLNFYLRVKAIIWLGLSYLFQIRAAKGGPSCCAVSRSWGLAKGRCGFRSRVVRL